MAGSSTSNKARGKELGRKLQTTGEARLSCPFVVVSGSSHSNDTRMPTTRHAYNGPKPLRATNEVASAAFAGGVVVNFAVSSPLEIVHLRPSEPNAPNNHHHHTTPQRPQRPRRLSWSPSHSSAAHHASLCMARLRAAAASELTPPKAEARAPRCGGVELPSRTTRPRTTRTRELYTAPRHQRRDLGVRALLASSARHGARACGGMGRGSIRSACRWQAPGRNARRRAALSACSRYSTAMRARRHQTRTP
jgi:hypothetical protein